MVYVDWLQNNGWVLYGHKVKNCHMYADTTKELIDFALSIRLKKRWLQKSNRGVYHFDLTPRRRHLAIAEGAHIITEPKEWLKLNKRLSGRN